jgi:hypothetical protein
MFRKTERDSKRRNTVSDEKIRDEETEATEDVEGHGLVNEPNVSSPNISRDDEDSDDVEAHGLINEPNISQPNIS